MFKKLLAACLLMISASFATWDYFPILPGGLGQMKGQVTYEDQDPFSRMRANIAARYSLTNWLEINAKFGYLFFTHANGDDTDIDGFENLPFGLRLQLNPAISIFGDFVAPIGDDSFNDDDWSYYFGMQHTSFMGRVLWGSELGIGIYSDGDYFTLFLGDELDFVLGSFIPLVGFNFVTAYYDDDYRNDSMDTGYDLYLGFKFGVSLAVSIEFSVHFQGGDYYEYMSKDPMIFNMAFYRMF